MNDGSREHLFIINPESFPRKGDMGGIITRIEDYFGANQIPGFSYHVSRYPRDAISVIRKHLSLVRPETTVRVYAVGGDGIAFDCLNGIVGLPNAELAIMPYGGGDDFIRAFGNEHYELFRDIALQVAAPVVPTDVIHCGNNYTLNFCTVGMDAAATINTIPMNKKLKKIRVRFPGLNSLLYMIGGIKSAFDKNVLNQIYELNADGVDLSGAYIIINIANGASYASGKSAIPTAVPDDGLLDMLVIRKITSAQVLRSQADYLNGNSLKNPDVCFLRRVKKVSIRSDTPLWINLDGEAFFDSDLAVEIIPGAVKIAAVNNLAYQKRVEFHEQ
jgi:diacylglycerol kinase family enzyme